MKNLMIGLVAGTILEVVAYGLIHFGQWDLVGTTDTVGEVWALLHPGLCLWMMTEATGFAEWLLVFAPSWAIWVIICTATVAVLRRLHKKRTAQP